MHVLEDGGAFEFFKLVILRRSQQHFEFPVAFVGLQNERHLGAKRLVRGTLHVDFSDRERQQVGRQAKAGGNRDEAHPKTPYHPAFLHVTIPFYA